VKYNYSAIVYVLLLKPCLISCLHSRRLHLRYGATYCNMYVLIRLKLLSLKLQTIQLLEMGASIMDLQKMQQLSSMFAETAQSSEAMQYTRVSRHTRAVWSISRQSWKVLAWTLSFTEFNPPSILSEKSGQSYSCERFARDCFDICICF
jgi:hypothetical protein